MAVTVSPRRTDHRQPVIPPLFQPRTFLRAYATVALFFLVAVAGEWIVHQLEYLIEYGRQFGPEMAATPHRYYMGPAGAALAAGTLLALTLTALALRLHGLEYRRLRQLLPRSVQELGPRPYVPASPRAIARTTLVLAIMQIAVYLVQENLEAMAEGLSLPGLQTLIGAQHLTVLPLHLLIALCLATILWTAVSLLRRSRSLVQQIRLLVRLFLSGQGARPHPRPVLETVPNREFISRSRSLRSPPLAA